MQTMTGKNEFSAPRGVAPTGTLRFLDGVSNVRLRSDRDMAELFRARFEGKVPRVEAADGIVTVRYRRGPGGWGGWRRARGEVVLNAMVPWTIHVQGGVSNLDADLTGIRLTALEIGNGVSGLDAALPAPEGDVVAAYRGRCQPPEAAPPDRRRSLGPRGGRSVPDPVRRPADGSRRRRDRLEDPGVRRRRRSLRDPDRGRRQGRLDRRPVAARTSCAPYGPRPVTAAAPHAAAKSRASATERPDPSANVSPAANASPPP